MRFKVVLKSFKGLKTSFKGCLYAVDSRIKPLKGM